MFAPISSVNVCFWFLIFDRLDIRASMIGNRSMLPISLQETICQVEEATKAKSGLHIVAAVSYGGRYDIIQACRSIAKKVKDSLIQPQHVNESLFG